MAVGTVSVDSKYQEVSHISMKGKLTEEEIIGIIKDYPEQSKFDWKMSLDLSSNRNKSELVKDVVAIANAHGNYEGYIIYGVNPRETDPIIGNAQSFDDAMLQQIVNSKISKPINFLYTESFIRGKTVGVLCIDSIQERPIMINVDYEVLRRGTIPIRRGSSSDFASAEDLQRMLQDPYKAEVMKQKALYIQKAIYEKAPLSHIVGEYLELMQAKNDANEITWAISELKGFSMDIREKVEELNVEYRRVRGYVSIAKIEDPGWSTLDQIRLGEPKYFWEFRMLMTLSIFQLEPLVARRSSFLQMSFPSKALVEQGFSENIETFKTLYFYFQPIEIERIFIGIKERILRKLI